MATHVKICGLTNIDDALFAAQAGAAFLGFIFAESPRRISEFQASSIIEAARRIGFPDLSFTGVFVAPREERPGLTIDEVARIAHAAQLDVVQLHHYSSEDCSALREKGFQVARVFRVRDAESLKEMDDFEVDYYHCDAWHPQLEGGTGQTFDHTLVREEANRRRLILAGGLTPENVAEAVRSVQPFAVDVSSGVEGGRPGTKDHGKIEKFIQSARTVY